MKIICIGLNYIDHAKEFKNELPDKPVFFIKPDSALLINNKPFFLPDFTKDMHHEVEIIIKINRLGKNIAKQFAHRYYNEIGIGIDFTARDLQNECRAKGMPWEISKAFDGGAVVGSFLEKSVFNDLNNIQFHLDINGKTVQLGHTKDMVFKINEIISYVSQFMTLKIGDIIFTGTPAGVGKVNINDCLKAYIGDQLLLDFSIK